MTQTVIRGDVITLDAFVWDNDGHLVAPDSITITILGPSGTPIVTDAAPTLLTLGHYSYDYHVPNTGTAGEWQAQWTAVIDGDPVTTLDPFTVRLAVQAAIGEPRNTEVCAAWATHEDAVGDCATYDTDTNELDAAMKVASDILFNLTRRRWAGQCVDTIRPNARYRRRAERLPLWWPADAQSQWGYCTCNRERENGCASVPEIELRGHPVDTSQIEDGGYEFVQVKIDGEPFTEFRVDDGRYLVRTDGAGWPCCQQMHLQDSEPRTWSVSYVFGMAPPIGGVRAAAELGCQLYRASTGDPGCKLPKRVQSITRQGVTIAVLDPLTLFKDGLTGLANVDLWVASVNQGAKSRRGAVMVPGRWRGARRPGP